MSAPARPADRGAGTSAAVIRLVAALCAVLVLLVGVWAASHSERGIAAAVESSTAATTTIADADTHAPTAAAGSPVVDSELGGMLTGIAVCLLLVLLGFLPLALARLMLRPSRLLAGASARPSPRAPRRRVRSHLPALTITQLSLSRT